MVGAKKPCGTTPVIVLLDSRVMTAEQVGVSRVKIPGVPVHAGGTFLTVGRESMGIFFPP